VRPTRAEISLSVVKHNLSQIRKRVGDKVKIMGVVKANAYGHGIIEIAKAITKKEFAFYVDYLGVAILEEGQLLRKNGIDFPIHVFIPPLDDQIEEYPKYNLEPTVTSFELAQKINSIGANLNVKIPIHIKIDTGMGRIGMSFKTSVETIKEILKLNKIEIKGIYSHFATSDDKDKSFALLQLKRFKEIKDSLNAARITLPLFHIANSGAIASLPESFFDMVRPGISMYGYYPSDEMPDNLNLKPILSIKSQIAFTKIVDAGTSISYGRRFFTKEKTKIVSIPIGYADGFYRALTNKGNVLIKGKKYQVSGTVCMDQIMVDVGLDNNIDDGDEVILLGESNNQKLTAWDIANKINSIPYEVCCSISSRMPRIYFE
jgi:alanine racemase